MSNIQVCRICLCKGVKMYSANEYNLKLYYEEVMVKKVPKGDSLPQFFCYLCAGMLYKLHKFREKCIAGAKMLKVLARIGPITLDSINQSERRNKNLISPISAIKPSDKIKTCYITRHNKKRNIKLEKVLVKIENKGDSSDNNELKNIDINSDYDTTDTMCIREEALINIDDFNNKLDSTVSIECNIAESGPIANVIATVLNTDDKTFLNIDNRVSEESFNNVYIKENGTATVKEQLYDSDNEVTLIIDEINTPKPIKQSKNKTSKTKRNILKQQAKQRKQKRFEKKVLPQRVLEPEHWLMIHLTEEQALEEHRAKAQDPKYLGAAFSCEDCHIGFSREEMQIRHRKLKHDESIGKFECRFCSRRFRVKNQLSKHLQVHFTKFKCLRCNLIFSIKTSAQFHNDSHNGFTKKCELCGEEFIHISTYYTHLRSHRSEHVCSLCGASFVSTMGLKMHKKRKHLVQTMPVQNDNMHCSLCDIMFESRNAFDEHLIHSTMHADRSEESSKSSLPLLLLKGNKKIQRKNHYSRCYCRICNRGFASKTSYLIHHTIEHPGTPHPETRNSGKSQLGKSHPGKTEAGKSHPKKSQMGKSISTSHISDERVVCEICGISLAINSMPSHINSHTREKMFSCPTCGMKFTLKANVARHMVTHTGEKPFKCTLCEKRFTQKGSMHLHYRTYHLKESYPKRYRRPKISQDMSVVEDVRSGHDAEIGSMSNHINTHTREKEFICVTCYLQFVSKGSLNRHQLTHTGEKPFECSLCDKRFTQMCSMQLHYRTFHLKEPYPKRNRRKNNENQETSLFETMEKCFFFKLFRRNYSEASLKIDR